MTRRSIVTSQPDVACDMCGRRLLRGERPDIFLAAEDRRTVCELCVPRARHAGWLHASEAEHLAVSAPRARRALSLIDRLRQLRFSAAAAEERIAPEELPLRPRRRRRMQHEEQEETHGDAGMDLRGGSAPAGRGRARAAQEGWELATAPASERATAPASEPATAIAAARRPQAGADAASRGERSAEDLHHALDVFNGSDCAARVAGIARALGAPCVAVRPLEPPQEGVAIVISWELCWYRYEVSLDAEAQGASVVLAADGMELDELPADDRAANAAADERGELSLLM